MKVGVRNAYERPRFAEPRVRVFFDVFRASTTLLAVLSKRPDLVVTTNDLDVVRRRQAEGYELVSEVFDGGLDNSPTQVLAAELTGRRVVHKSTNLTTAMFANGLAPVTLIGGFVNAARLVAHVKTLAPREVELVAASHFEKGNEALEDMACAEMIALGLKLGLPESIPRLRSIEEKVRLLKARKPDIPPHYWVDTDFCLRLDALPVLAEARAVSPGVMEIRAI